MRTRFVILAGLAALGAPVVLGATPGHAADCDQGSAEEQISCLNRALGDLEEKVAELTKQMKSKASADDVLKWYDRVALMNEDMRIYPRCLDNPGPDSQNITDVLVTSCAKVPAQTWMIVKPYTSPKKK